MSRNTYIRKTPMSVILAGIGALAIALSGCGSATPERTDADREIDFLFYAHQERSLEAIDDQTLIDVGWDLCWELRDGVSVYDILDEAKLVFTTPTGQRGFASVLAAAVTSLCPDQADKVDSTFDN